MQKFGIPGLHLFLKGLLGVDPVHICLLVPFRVFFYPRWFVVRCNVRPSIKVRKDL